MRKKVIQNYPSQRWWLVGLMFAGIAVNYIDRVNLSAAIIPIAKELSLTPVQQGIVLSSFSWGYVIFMLIGGLLVDRIGSIKSAALAAIAWSLATFFTGISSSWKLLLISRVGVGMCEAPIFPANAKIVKENFPLEERGRATGIFDAGSYLGTAITAPLIIYIMVDYGWRWSFYVSALIGIVWAFIWLKMAPKIINNNNITSQFSKTKNLYSYSIVLKLVRNRKIIGASLGFFCYNYAKSFFLTWFPSYLLLERGFSLLSIGLYGMIPALCAIFGDVFAGWVTDKMIKNGYSVTLARKLPLVLGLLLSSTISLSVLVDSQWAILALLSFSFAATIAASPGIWAIPGDISPSDNLIGTIGGIQNMFSNIAGIVAPITTGAIIAQTGSFSPALVLTGAIAVIGALSYWYLVGNLEPIVLDYDYENEDILKEKCS